MRSWWRGRRSGAKRMSYCPKSELALTHLPLRGRGRHEQRVGQPHAQQDLEDDVVEHLVLGQLDVAVRRGLGTRPLWAGRATC